MRFVIRGLLGSAFVAVTALLVVVAAWRLADTLGDRDGPARSPAAQERIYMVATTVLVPQTIQPVIETHGTVRSWRTVGLHAPVAGRIVGVAEQFRDGAEIAAGDVLVRIDPADYESQVAEAMLGVAKAEADAAEARQAVTAAEIEHQAAMTRRELRAAILARQRNLAGRGIVTGSAADEAELALATAVQAVASLGQAVVASRLGVERAALAVRRAELALAEARRNLADTAIRAPFDGVLAKAAVGLGDLAAVNDTLGVLIDPAALEVTFRVTNAEYGSLLNGEGRLRQLPVTVRLPMGEDAMEIGGTLDRPGAMVGEGRTGRVLFARLDPVPGLPLKPDDFVTVSLAEPPLEGVAVLPAGAVDREGRILVLGTSGRLEEKSATILRRTGNTVILADVPFGLPVVTERSPQLVPGLRARSRAAPEPAREGLTHGPASGTASG